MSRDGNPLDALTRVTEAAEAATGDDQRAAAFARGLVFGALVGAAIAGSTIWQRRHARPKSELATLASTDTDGGTASPPKV